MSYMDLDSLQMMENIQKLEETRKHVATLREMKKFFYRDMAISRGCKSVTFNTWLRT
jgi:DNA-directed RNA polymerase specialized sigma24 family protein